MIKVYKVGSVPVDKIPYVATVQRRQCKNCFLTEERTVETE